MRTSDNNRKRWAISIVSHGHGRNVLGIVNDLAAQLNGRDYRIILTLNIPERSQILAELPEDIRRHVTLRRNLRPIGFGANHNAALADVDADLVLMADPDLRLSKPIFAALEKQLANPLTGVVSPRAITPDGQLEDNGRPLFTPTRLLKRYLLGRRHDSRRLVRQYTNQVDWLAGLFLATRQSVFENLQGFDTRFFMYCEDIDFCLRIQQLGLSCRLINDVEIIHPPRRATLRNMQHLMWHLRSLLRLWRSPAYRAFKRSENEPGAVSKA